MCMETQLVHKHTLYTCKAHSYIFFILMQCVCVCVGGMVSPHLYDTFVKGGFQILFSLSPFNDLILAFSRPWYGIILIILHCPLLDQKFCTWWALLQCYSINYVQGLQYWWSDLTWICIRAGVTGRRRQEHCQTIQNTCAFLLECQSTQCTLLLNLGFDTLFFVLIYFVFLGSQTFKFCTL